MDLVNQGADPNRMSDALESDQDTQSSNKWSIACSPLQYACCQGHNEVVKALVAAGGDVNKPNRKGYTALHYAVLMGKMETSKLLVELGADLCARDSFGDEPVDRAEQAEHHELAQWLKQAMAQRGLTRSHPQVVGAPSNLSAGRCCLVLCAEVSRCGRAGRLRCIQAPEERAHDAARRRRRLLV